MALCAARPAVVDSGGTSPRASLSVCAGEPRTLQDGSPRSTGNLRGRFEGSGLNLFLRGVIMWLLVVGPFIAAIVVAIMTVDPVASKRAGGAGGRRDQSSSARDPGFYVAVVLQLARFLGERLRRCCSIPAFQALTIRWWASGLRFGEVAVHSQLRTGQIYGGHLRFLLYAILFRSAVGFLAWIGIEGFEVATPSHRQVAIDRNYRAWGSPSSGMWCSCSAYRPSIRRP